MRILWLHIFRPNGINGGVVFDFAQGIESAAQHYKHDRTNRYHWGKPREGMGRHNGVAYQKGKGEAEKQSDRQAPAQGFHTAQQTFHTDLLT